MVLRAGCGRWAVQVLGVQETQGRGGPSCPLVPASELASC